MFTVGRLVASILMHRHVGALVRADHLGLELALVGEAHRDLVGGLDHVRIGQDVAVRADDEAGAERARFLVARLPRRAEAAEEIEERIVLRPAGRLSRTLRRCAPWSRSC